MQRRNSMLRHGLRSISISRGRWERTCALRKSRSIHFFNSYAGTSQGGRGSYFQDSSRRGVDRVQQWKGERDQGFRASRSAPRPLLSLSMHNSGPYKGSRFDDSPIPGISNLKQ